MANVPTTAWSETTPAGSDDISQGDNRIRELKTQIREVVDVDHKFDSSGQDADMGKHNQCSFIEAADIGSGAEGLPILGAQTVSGKAELMFTDEDDNDVQITSGGKLYMVDILNAIYPIGSVVTLGVSTNPGTLYGVGTWTAIEGKVVVGIAGSGTFDTLDATGGEEEVTLDETMIPAHTHTYPYGDTDGVGTNYVDNNATNDLGTKEVSSTGGGLPHENMPPYIVKYVWQRTA